MPRPRNERLRGSECRKPLEKNNANARLEDFFIRPQLHEELSGVEFFSPIRDFESDRCRNNHKETTGVPDDVGDFLEVVVRVDEGPDTGGGSLRGAQCLVRGYACGFCESGDATLVEEYYVILGNLQHSGELEGETADEKPEQEYRLS